MSTDRSVPVVEETELWLRPNIDSKMSESKPNFSGKWQVYKNENFEDFMLANGKYWQSLLCIKIANYICISLEYKVKLCQAVHILEQTCSATDCFISWKNHTAHIMCDARNTFLKYCCNFRKKKGKIENMWWPFCFAILTGKNWK